MKHTIYIILSACLLALNACTSDDILPKEENTDSEVQLTAAIAGSGVGTRAEESDLTPDCIKKRFGDGDEIRFVNTVFFNTPDFADGTIFEYAGEDPTYGSRFTKNGGTSGTGDDGTVNLNWNDFRPTGFVYTFEAVYYPNNQELKFVPENQNEENGKPDNFIKADLLLASNRMDLNPEDKNIKLTFRHAFAMVRVDITIPIGLGLDADAIEEAVLQNVQTGYTVDYQSSIDSGELRGVMGEGDQKEVTMYKYSTNKTTTTQDYTFVAIIPVQTYINQDDFVRFKIKVNDEDKWYGFKRNENQQTISLVQSKITHLVLKLDNLSGTPLLISAEVKDWLNASSDMTIGEDDSTSPSDTEGSDQEDEGQEGGTENEEGGNE